MALHSSNTNFKVEFNFGSYSIVNDSNASAFMSQILIGNTTSTNLYNLLGLMYLGSSNTSSTTTINLGGASSGAASNTCNIVLETINLEFNTNNNTKTFTIRNKGTYDITAKFVKPMVSTAFGEKDLISIISEYNLKPNDQKDINITVDNSQVREVTESFINIKSARCNISLPIKIYDSPPIFYDVRISTDQMWYSCGDVINASIYIENMGDIPDKDTILKCYMVDSGGLKTYYSEEMLYEVSVGLNTFNRNYLLQNNCSMGLYKIGIEYETEQQGLLRAENSVLVVQNKKLIYYILIGVVSISFISFILFIIGRKKEHNRK